MNMNKGILAGGCLSGCLGLLLAIGPPLKAADGDAKKGEAVFDNCAVCHNSDSTETKIGPGLKGLFKREKLVNGQPVLEDNVKALITESSDSVPPFTDGSTADAP